MAVFCIIIKEMKKSTSVTEAIRQTLQIDRAIRLVWTAAPGWMILNSLIVIIQGVLPLIALYLMREIVDTVTAGVQAEVKAPVYSELAGWLILAAGTGLLIAFLRSIGELASQAQSYLVTDHVSDLLHAQSIKVDLEYYEDSEYYDTLHRAQAEAAYRPTSIVNGLVNLAQNLISLAGVIGLFIYFNPALGLVMILAAIPGALVRLYYARKTFRFEQEQAQSERLSWYHHWLIISSEYAKEMRLFDLGSLLVRRYKELRKELRQGRLNLTQKRVIVDFLAQALATLAIFASLGLAAYQAITGAISLGDLIAIYMGFQLGLNAMQTIMRSLAGLYEDNLFLTHFYQFLELEPKIKEPARAVHIPSRIQAGIQFDDVTFHYPNNDTPVLQNLTLSIKPGKVIALVGVNGSGKTTLVKLLCRLYDPKEGKITIDGIDIRQVDPQEWRKRISVIFQDFAKYQFSVWENIWLGNVSVDPDLETVKDAARKSGADPFIQRLPQGYQTNLGTWFEEGLDISGGEWQKIALARAFMRDTEIVILDEPTSSLDPLAEAELFHQFRHLIQGKSAIIISHRFSTVEMADEIFVLEGGKITEHGSHQELIQLGGEYARFYEAQAQFFK